MGDKGNDSDSGSDSNTGLGLGVKAPTLTDVRVTHAAKFGSAAPAFIRPTVAGAPKPAAAAAVAAVAPKPTVAAVAPKPTVAAVASKPAVAAPSSEPIPTFVPVEGPPVAAPAAPAAEPIPTFVPVEGTFDPFVEVPPTVAQGPVPGPASDPSVPTPAPAAPKKSRITIPTAASAGASAGAGASAAAGPTLIVTELPEKKVRPTPPPKPIALPADAPLMEKEELTHEMKERFKGVDPVKAKPPKISMVIDAKKGTPEPVFPYRPISSAAFGEFITQTYSQYSPYLERVLRDGVAAAAEPKEMDQDACKKRDPNKVETFYYQSFIRDYLSRGSPYRGLLVYHGLGTGKTCTSIAAAEALYWGGQKTIYVLTPASLSNNYRKDLAKCGYYPLRQKNFWAFLKLAGDREPAGDPTFAWLTGGLGLSPETVIAQGGGWIPNPDKPSNWDSLSPAVKEAIRGQQIAHLNFRFKFMHYNGIMPEALSNIATDGIKAGQSNFDNAVIIIDEVHNLVRTINGTQIGKIPMSQFIEKVEPREHTWTAPLAQKTPGYKYPRGYTFYRLLQNAVGSKIIALSATPMINYAQEFAILLNLIGGEQRMVEISLKNMSREPTELAKLEAWVRQRPDIDFYGIEEDSNRNTVLNVTPVPFGFVKVVAGDYSTRGFVRLPVIKIGSVKNSRERNMDKWGASLVGELESMGILTAAGGAGADAPATAFKLYTMPMLPEDATTFISNFVNRDTLKIMHSNVLKARASGLISYYRGGSEELMPRTGKNELVLVPFSDFMFKRYVAARMQELELESTEKPEEAVEMVKRKDMTAAEGDLYAQATTNLAQGFLCLSRAACNWTFPEEVPRPVVDKKQQEKLLGMEADTMLSVDAVAPPRIKKPTIPKAATAAASSAAAASAAASAALEVEETEGVVLPDEAPPPPEPVDPVIQGMIGTLMAGLEAKADIYLNASLPEFSSKYATMIDTIRKSPGPALVYSQFITLEGLGIFAAALRASDEKYLPLDLVRDDGEWIIPDALMTPEALARPRYVLYTGAQDPEKRRLLLQLYNADVANLPRRLRTQCETILAGAPDNRDGRVCRVFMISASGAEGISLFNTRQVNIMEPYWNNVRLQQVAGRAIRLCSHANLPWEDRVVDVYTYLSVFSPKQKAEGAKALMLADKSKTTDEIIYSIAMKKQRLADGLYEIAQTAATDCELHFHEHGAVTQCYKFAEGSRPMFAYHPDWQKDIKDSGVKSISAAAGAGAGAGAEDEDDS